MNAEIDLLRQEVLSLRRELEQARREYALIRPHLFNDDGDMITTGTSGLITLGGNTEGNEAAVTDTWARGAGVNANLAVWKTCRVVYNDSGDKKLYEYRRLFTYDSRGLLLGVGIENRIEIDAPGSCP